MMIICKDSKINDSNCNIYLIKLAEISKILFIFAV